MSQIQRSFGKILEPVITALRLLVVVNMLSGFVMVWNKLDGESPNSIIISIGVIAAASCWFWWRLNALESQRKAMLA